MAERRKKKCIHIKKNGERCGRWARDGFSVCPQHGAGTKKNPGGRPPTHGMTSKKLKKRLKEKIEKYKGDKNLLSIRHNIATKRALLDVLLKKAAKKSLNVNMINNANQILTGISQDIERLEKIEKGEKHVVTVNILSQTINLIVNVIDKNIPDERLKDRIFAKFAEFGLVDPDRVSAN